MIFHLYLNLICLVLICHGRDDVPLSDQLWNETVTLHQAALSSAFIKGLAHVSLDPTAFGGYMVQDAIYCYQVKQSIDLAIPMTTDKNLREFLAGRSKSYDRYYKALFKEWHIQNAEGISLGHACTDYVNHIHNVATTMDPYYLVTAMIPCAKLWPWLGGQINSTTGNFGVYTAWVKENLDSGSKGFSKYEKVINDAFNDKKIDKETALSVYRRSMEGEVAFFSSVMKESPHDEL